jgi:hypothetical protein
VYDTGVIRVNRKYNGLANNTRDFEELMRQNNCYSYAINQPVDPFTLESYSNWEDVQPGNIGGRNGRRIKFKEYEDIILLAKDDLLAIGYELKETTLEEYIETEGAWKIAFAHGSEDYHWYRQNDDGTWSYKMGGSFVYYEDAIGQPIGDPKTCARGPYIHFVGYYMVIPIVGFIIKDEDEEDIA